MTNIDVGKSRSQWTNRRVQLRELTNLTLDTLGESKLFPLQIQILTTAIHFLGNSFTSSYVKEKLPTSSLVIDIRSEEKKSPRRCGALTTANKRCRKLFLKPKRSFSLGRHFFVHFTSVFRQLGYFFKQQYEAKNVLLSMTQFRLAVCFANCLSSNLASSSSLCLDFAWQTINSDFTFCVLLYCIVKHFFVFH